MFSLFSVLTGFSRSFDCCGTLYWLFPKWNKRNVIGIRLYSTLVGQFQSDFFKEPVRKVWHRVQVRKKRQFQSYVVQFPLKKSQGSVPHLWEPLGNPCTFFSFLYFFYLLLFVIQKYQLTETNQPENIIWYVTLLLCNGIALQSRYALHLWGVIIVTAMAVGMVTSWHRLYAKMHSTTVNRLFKVTPEKQPG